MERIIGVQEAPTPKGLAANIHESGSILARTRHLIQIGRQQAFKRFELADGRPLKLVGRGAYKVEGTDEVFLVTGR